MKIDKQLLYAFWKYDTYPYILGGSVTRIQDDGSVETQEYGPGFFFRPIKILPHSEGIKLQAELNDIRAEYHREQNLFRADWRKKVDELFPFNI